MHGRPLSPGRRFRPDGFLDGGPVLLDLRRVRRGLRLDQLLNRRRLLLDFRRARHRFRLNQFLGRWRLLFDLWRVGRQFGLAQFLDRSRRAPRLWRIRGCLGFARFLGRRWLPHRLRRVGRQYRRDRLSAGWRFFLCLSWDVARRRRRGLSGFPRGLGRDHALALEFPWARGRRNCWLAPICGHELLASHAGGARLIGLQLRRPDMLLLLRQEFFVRRLGDHAAGAAVEARAIGGCVGDDRLIVDIGNVGGADIVHRGIVEEAPIVPAPALVAGAGIAEPVTNPTVESDALAPIAGPEGVHAADESPVARRPQ